MGKFGAIILSLSILFQSAGLELNDMYKIPLFITHLSNHIDEGDNFSDFMDLHYGTDVESHKNKHQEHKELPFKHQHNDTHMHIVYALHAPKIELSSLENIFENKIFYYKKPFISTYENSFFQPPQK
jgi:hypothetical protein